MGAQPDFETGMAGIQGGGLWPNFNKNEGYASALVFAGSLQTIRSQLPVGAPRRVDKYGPRGMWQDTPGATKGKHIPTNVLNIFEAIKRKWKQADAWQKEMGNLAGGFVPKFHAPENFFGL